MEAGSPTKHFCSVKELGKQWKSAVLWWNFPSRAFDLPLAWHSCRLHAVWPCLSSTKEDCQTTRPAKERRSIHKSFAKVILVFAKNGRLQKRNFGQPPHIHKYTYHICIYIYICLYIIYIYCFYIFIYIYIYYIYIFIYLFLFMFDASINKQID